MSLPTAFLNSLARLDANDLSDWLTDGLIRFHERNSDGYQRVAVAFSGATYSLGFETAEQRAVDLLLALHAHLFSQQPNLFDHAVAVAIDLLPLNTDSRNEALRDLIEVAINTKNSFAIDAIRNKLRIVDPVALRIVCSDAVHFLYEGDAQPQLVALGQFMLTEIDFPFEISAHLLVGLCRLNIDEAANYVFAAEKKLGRQLDALSAYPDRLHEFKQDFCDAVFQAVNKSSLIATLLRTPLYAKLLEDRLEIDDEYAAEIEYVDDAPVAIVPIHAAVHRKWLVPLLGLCATALGIIAYRQRGLSSQSTLDSLESALAPSPIAW